MSPRENRRTHVGQEERRIYRSHHFSVAISDGWQDKTIYTIGGPVTDGIQHNIVITVHPDVQVETLRDFADWNIAAMKDALKSCRLLKQAPITLANGLPAYQAVFCWYPTDELRLYQEQVYVLQEGTGYVLTASFTKKTRKTLGPQVERMFLSFNPEKPPVMLDRGERRRDTGSP